VVHSGMTQSRRRVFRAFAVAAMIVFVASAAVFLVNRFRVFLVSHTTATEFRNLTVSNGAVWYGWASVQSDPSSIGWGSAAFGRMSPQDSNFDPLAWRPVLRSKPKNFVLVIPLWMIAVPSAAVAAWLIVISRRRAGHCECGYKLAGLTDLAPCPECGRPARPNLGQPLGPSPN